MKGRKVLYHGTSIEGLAGILIDDRIDPCVPDEYDEAHDGASLTTSLAVAQKFAAESKERDWEGRWNSPVEDGVILVFDRDAVVNGVGGKEVCWDGSGTEKEFRTFGPMHDVMGCLVQVRLDEGSLPWWISAFEREGESEKAEALRNIPVDLLSKRGREAPVASQAMDSSPSPLAAASTAATASATGATTVPAAAASIGTSV